MRIFLAGDAVSGTGPANVTKYYIDNLPEGTLFQKNRNKLLRTAGLLINTLRCDVAVYSGYSRQNIPGLKLAKLFGRPSAYIMHGCVEYENSINLVPDEKMNATERRTLELADLVIAVSESFAKWLRGYYPMYADKIDHVTNGIDPALFDESKNAGKRDPHMIFSVGGGMPRKKIVHICEAVKKLRSIYDKDMYLCVAGDEGADTDGINSYDFVDNRGIVTFEENIHLYERAALFVQNSSFETFGLAPVEAIACGCSTLCSRHVGALDLIDDLQGEDVIENFDDPDEIAEKIRYNLENPNASRLLAGMKGNSHSWKVQSEALISKLSKLVSSK